MSREALDFYDIRGDIAFLNGIFTVYMEEILYPAISGDPLFCMCIDIFSIGDDDAKTRVDVALTNHIRNYLEIGHTDKYNSFIPLPSSDDFHIPFEEEVHKVQDINSGEETMKHILYHLLKQNAVSEGKLSDAVKKFVERTPFFLEEPLSGIYMASPDVVKQLDNNMHFFLITSSAVFFEFGTTIMLFTTGYED